MHRCVTYRGKGIDMKAVISGLLGTAEFDESLFRRRISGITAKEAHRLITTKQNALQTCSAFLD